MGSRWVEYVEAFHEARSGVTERILRRSAGPEGDAYEWLAEAVPSAARVLDVACGSAPLWADVPASRYVGIDASAGELAIARSRGAPVARACAAALPCADGSVDVVACSMALQVLQPLPVALAEMARVLRPGGRLVATIPATGPLSLKDVTVLAGLIGVLGKKLKYPNDELLRDPSRLLSGAGLRLVDDTARRFAYRLGSPAEADLLLASLYLPGVSGRRYTAARGYLRALARLGVTVAVPIRRLIAQRT